MRSIVKVKCNICKCKTATWEYIPCGWRYYCDDCVPRGCSCNIISEEGEETVEATDELGRLLPCCEFSYSRNGWTANFLLNRGTPQAKWVNVLTYKSHYRGYVIWKGVYAETRQRSISDT